MKFFACDATLLLRGDKGQQLDSIYVALLADGAYAVSEGTPSFDAQS